MANVLIRNVPDEVLNHLKELAKLHNRSLQQELREILERSAAIPSYDFAQRATEIRNRLAATGRTFSDTVELLREDRNV